MTRALIPIENQVDLVKLYLYQKGYAEMIRRRQKFFRLHDSAIELAGKYLEEMPEAETIKRLRRDIRIATRGTPDTIGQDAVQVAGYVSMQTEMLYNAQSHLVKNAWRMVAPLVHPDRRGGDMSLFQSALAAYRLKDLTYLQDLWITLQKDNVFWRSGKEAEEYIETELKRPEVSLTRLRVKPEFQIVMLDRSGRKEQAREYASTFAQRLIVMLQGELHFLLTGEVFDPNKPNVEDSQDGNEEETGPEGKSWNRYQQGFWSCS